MRKITQDIVNAFIAGNARTIGNSHTDGEGLYLHGNCIAKKEGGQILVSNAGWTSNTTKERLNGLLDVLGKPRIYQRDWEWYWKDGEEFPFHIFVAV